LHEPIVGASFGELNRPIVDTSINETSIARKRNVSGYVFDELNMPLIGASILETGTANGVITNFDGWFELHTTKDTTELRIFSIGMFTETIKITSDTIITVFLQPDWSACWDIIIPRDGRTCCGRGTRRRIRNLFNR
jgi:hypothetical protein